MIFSIVFGETALLFNVALLISRFMFHYMNAKPHVSVNAHSQLCVRLPYFIVSHMPVSSPHIFVTLHSVKNMYSDFNQHTIVQFLYRTI